MLSPDVGGSGYLGIIAVLFVLAAVAASVYLFCSYWRAWCGRRPFLAPSPP